MKKCTFTSADSQQCVLPDFDLFQNQARADYPIHAKFMICNETMTKPSQTKRRSCIYN